ncbi:MAG: pgl 2 [Thermomicrobiales bacterium]|jgi:6-phosphogluconolactonase|nr:pgl 2 [Thermomicrobiales bacterium]MDF2758378.1 pgl 2 [Thermomicrobiales bacterium]MDF3016683.1 pgl 2 [Thermomicrobiales bacterium]
MFVYVGAYTEPPSGSADGIAVFRFDDGTGELHPVQTVPGVVNPSWLTLDGREQVLFAVNEEGEGRISAFARDAATGMLRPLNDQRSHGADPCYVSLDSSGRYVLVANYSGGTVAVLPVADDGRLAAATCVIHHQGTGIRPEQEGPHPHMIRPSADGRCVLVTDLGIDQVLVYRLDTSTGQLTPNEQGPAAVMEASGAGPRHFAFAPSGRTVYVINELNSTVTVHDYAPERGELHARQVVSTLPAGVDGPAMGNSCAHIAISPDGRFVYGSNRGHDSIAIWEVADVNGELRPVGHEATRGKTPRNFSLDPTGAWLLVANQDSDTIVPFRRDPGSGRLTATGSVTRTPSPVAILFSQD